MKNTDHVTMTK